MENLRDFNKVSDEQLIEEGWKEELFLIGAVVLSGIGGLQAQNSQNMNRHSEEVVQNMEVSYCVLVGYISGMPFKNPEEMSYIKEERVYFENLRDGKHPKKLSQGAQIVVDYAINEVKKLGANEFVHLAKKGGGYTRM